MEKTDVAYYHSGTNPFGKGVTHVGGVLDRDPLYVRSTYKLAQGRTPPISDFPNYIILPVQEAEKLFHFREGRLVDITRG